MGLRLIGTLLVVVGSVGLGWYFSMRESFRQRDLINFKKALLMLASEIEYKRTTLPEACTNITKRTDGEVSNVFTRFGKLLSENNGETAYQLWVQALKPCQTETHLQPEDFIVLEDFGKTLGYLDKQMQKNAINIAVSYIDEKVTILGTSSEKNKRMYRSLGLCGGMMLSVVLW